MFLISRLRPMHIGFIAQLVILTALLFPELYKQSTRLVPEFVSTYFFPKYVYKLKKNWFSSLRLLKILLFLGIKDVWGLV